MKQIRVICPKCGATMWFKNYWHWVWKSQMHWLKWDKEDKYIRDYRKTKCSNCGQKSYMKREK